MNLPACDFTVLDTETTGFVPKVHRIIEFASVRSKNGAVVDEYEQLLHIDDDVPPMIEMLTRINTEDLDGKPTMDDLREEIAARIGTDTLIVGQNVSFDIGMLKGEGIDLTDRPWVDTSMLASLVFPEFHSYSLSYMSKELELNHAPVHRALGDVNATLELFEKCWERLLELPPELLNICKTIFAKSSPGYQMLAKCLPDSTAETIPLWLTAKREVADTHAPTESSVLPDTQDHKVSLVEESLDRWEIKKVLQESIESDTPTWIAVKNIESLLRRIQIPDEVSVLYPPFLLIDTDAVKELALQETYTADEATLAIKLAWYEPATKKDIPLHGNEKALWYGRIACTKDSEAYKAQFLHLHSVVLVDHRHILELLKEESPDKETDLPVDCRIVIDDASMLEDTSTKAFGYRASLDELRSQIEGEDQLIKAYDLLSLWVERTRNNQDDYRISKSDLQTEEATAVHDILENLDVDSLQLTKQLNQLRSILSPTTADDHIIWISTMKNGSQILSAAPEKVSYALKKHLYSKPNVVLLIPPHSADSLQELIPDDVDRTLYPLSYQEVQIEFSAPKGETIQGQIPHLTECKTVVLAPSKRIIEEIFVAHTKELEEQGITLLCQGFAGSSGHMQARFEREEAPTILVVTPWAFETMEFNPGTIDALIIGSLPFDFPSHPVFSARADHFDNGFTSYSLPRLKQRLFRLLRTFVRYGSDNLKVTLLDKRVHEKSYGEGVTQYLMELCGGSDDGEISAPPIDESQGKQASQNESEEGHEGQRKAEEDLEVQELAVSDNTPQEVRAEKGREVEESEDSVPPIDESQGKQASQNESEEGLKKTKSKKTAKNKPSAKKKLEEVDPGQMTMF